MSTDYVSDLSPLIERTRGIEEWLLEVRPSCFSEQRHLNEGTTERTYWHYGYMVALNDALKILTGKSPLTEGRYTPPQDTHGSYSPGVPDE